VVACVWSLYLRELTGIICDELTIKGKSHLVMANLIEYAEKMEKKMVKITFFPSPLKPIMIIVTLQKKHVLCCIVELHGLSQLKNAKN
jgi:hypothetical protein